MKQQTFWYNGKLITRAEHDKLTHEEVQAWNNRITNSDTPRAEPVVEEVQDVQVETVQETA